VEELFNKPMNAELLDIIKDCIDFRNIVTPYISKFNELLGTEDSSKCLEEIVEILSKK